MFLASPLPTTVAIPHSQSAEGAKQPSPDRDRLLRNSAQITGWQDDSNGKGAVNGCKRSSVRSESGN